MSPLLPGLVPCRSCSLSHAVASPRDRRRDLTIPKLVVVFLHNYELSQNQRTRVIELDPSASEVVRLQTFSVATTILNQCKGVLRSEMCRSCVSAKKSDQEVHSRRTRPSWERPLPT